MSCNACRVLRRRCIPQCPFRPCLEEINSSKAQANAIIFVSKFFGRCNLLAAVNAVPDSKKSALFQSLLYDAAGRTVNPVGGAVDLLLTGNWYKCEDAVQKVFDGEELLPPMFAGDGFTTSSVFFRGGAWRANYSREFFMHGSDGGDDDDDEMMAEAVQEVPPAEASALTASFGNGGGYDSNKEPKLLNLFV